MKASWTGATPNRLREHVITASLGLACIAVFLVGVMWSSWR